MDLCLVQINRCDSLFWWELLKRLRHCGPSFMRKTAFISRKKWYENPPLLTSLVRPQQRQSSCCPLSMQCPWSCQKLGCTRTWASAPSGWCPRYGSFQMHLKRWKWWCKRCIIVLTLLHAHNCWHKSFSWVVYLQMQCRIHWGHTWQQ